MTIVKFESPQKKLEALEQLHFSECDRIENAKAQALDILEIAKQENCSELMNFAIHNLIEILFEDKEA